MGIDAFIASNYWILLLATLWMLPWKGYALWLSARKSQKWWFIILLVVNTFAILEIIYIFFIAKRDNKKDEAPVSALQEKN